MTGAEFVLECLKKEAVDTLFAYPGGAVIPLFDAMYKDGSFRVVRPSHEQGGSHAADGYARKSGRPGVCIATSGPGVTNTVTGVATAYLDSVPLVLITGQVGFPLMYKNSFQEVDTIGLMMPITKHSRLVTKPEHIADAIAEAFQIACSGRKGPVVVDITKDALMAEVTDESYTKREILPDTRHTQYTEEIREACRLIREAKRPVLYAGGGVINAGAAQELTRLAEQCNIPVVNSIMGLGSFDRTHPLSRGVVGMHGQKETNLLVYHSDVIVGVGVRFSDRAIGNRTGFTRDAKIIHIDTDPSEFDKNVDTHVRIAGDMKEILRAMQNELADVKKEDTPAPQDPDADFAPRRVLEKLQAALPVDTTVVTDVGQHQMWTMMYWKPRTPRTFLTSGGLGTMGFGMGAAIGAKVARPESPVVLITGDGSFRMNHTELLTAVKYQIPLLVVIFNNHSLGMVRQWQGLFNEERYAETDVYDPLNTELLCKAYGAEFMGAFRDPDELEAILAEEPRTSGVRVLEYILDHDHGVYPMVASGAAINVMFERK